LWGPSTRIYQIFQEVIVAKNILIFSDGTGQAGGVTPDENVSNIYKLFRATRCGPDSDIDPSEQLTFYDPGLGSQPDGGIFFEERAYRWIHNVASQATGLGITLNIIDCYAAILQMWQPGDRIFLFGFSRGAYTVRCVAAGEPAIRESDSTDFETLDRASQRTELVS
jgi:uncharacterized protein (DUF2235 family)